MLPRRSAPALTSEVARTTSHRSLLPGPRRRIAYRIGVRKLAGQPSSCNSCAARGKQTSQSNKGAGKKSTASQGKGPSDYAPQSRPRPSWHDMSRDPQASDSNWDQTRYTTPRQPAEHDPWQQASNPHRNAYREPWPPGSPLAQRPDWNAPQAQQSCSPPASDQGGEDLPLVPSKHIAPRLIEWCGTRPYFKNRRNNWACAYACTRTACRHGRPACNFTPYDVQTDMHFPHACSLCKADDNAGKGK